MVRPVRAAVLLWFLAAAGASALDLEVTMADVERALKISRAGDRESERFSRPYVHEIGGAFLKGLDVITEFRRMVLIADERRRAGDWMFVNGRQVPFDALKPWKHLVTITATTDFGSTTFVQPPLVEIALLDRSDRPLRVQRTRINPIYTTSGADPSASFMTGGVYEADFSAPDVGQHTRVLTVTMKGRGLARLAIDFSALE
jgi:hypothetical protein